MSIIKLKNITKNKRNIMIFSIFLVVVFIVVLILGRSFSAVLDNDVEVQPDTDLTYYLNVSYDGIDRNGTKSDDTTVAQINSGTLYIEDRIPDGLDFQGFVTTDNGSFGAVKRSDNTVCLGKVVDDTKEASNDAGTWNGDNTEFTYHGLHYDAANRLVSFKVENLQAGCYLTVGIITRTPATIDDPNTTEVEKRRDFYNFASIREKSLTLYSNTVHAYMGKETESLYNVYYEYTGTVPSGAPDLPDMTSYVKGTSVGVAPDVDLEGYTFSGWTTADISVTNGTFEMPEYDVTFRGSFTQKEKYKVTYALDGTTPTGYVLPAEKEYYPSADVTLDSLKAGDVINGYRFLGWITTDIDTIEDDKFIMPSSNITLTGQFEEVTYKLEYRFHDGVLPPNSDNYLPATRHIAPGTTVTLDEISTVPSGYIFLGWYKENESVMPSQDLIIYGEWKVQTGTFEPTISTEIVNPKSSYKSGDTISFKTGIKNNASFAITDVIVRANNDSNVFTSGTGYTVVSDHVAKFDNISANATAYVYSTYTVGSSDAGSVTNELELVSASANNNYELYEKDYKATGSFNIQSRLTVCVNVDGLYNSNTFQVHITGPDSYDTWLMLEQGECETMIMDPNTYRINEILPQEYSIKSVTGMPSNNSLVTVDSSNPTVTFTNTFVKKAFMHSFGRVKNIITQGGA